MTYISIPFHVTCYINYFHLYALFAIDFIMRVYGVQWGTQRFLFVFFFHFLGCLKYGK